MGPAWRATREERGAAAVEFALVAMVLLTIVCAIIQAALYLWAFEVAAHAAREGARRYAVDPCNASGQNVTITQSRASSAASTPVGVTATFSKGPGNSGAGRETGDAVTVAVTFSAHSIAGLVPPFSAISKTATARIEDVGECP